MKRSAFQQFADLEEQHWWFRGRRAVYTQLLRKALGAERPGPVLDLGAGVGGFLDSLGSIGEPVYFTELDGEAVRLANSRSAAIGMRAAADQLPLRTDSFGLICLFDVIEHVQADQRVLDECLRVLAPGGWLALSVPAHPWLFSRNDEVVLHVRRYRRPELVERVRVAGFQVRRATFANVFLFPAIATVVLAGKLLQRIAPRAIGAEHTNLSWKLPAVLHDALYAVFKSELVLSRRFDVAFGHSLFLLAQKPRP